MTQLTFKQRPALAVRQLPKSRSLTPESASEGDDQDFMARVRRSPSTGRSRRRGSEQPDYQRAIRPRAAASNANLPALQQPLSHTPYQSAINVTFRGLPPPPLPQLATSQWTSKPLNYAETQSPTSLGTPESSTLAHKAFEVSSPSTIDRNRTLSPLEYTPAQSISSLEQPGSQDGFAAILDSTRKRSDSDLTNFLDKTLHNGAVEPLAGVDAICDGDIGDWPPSRMHESTPPSSMMLPSALLHVRDLDEPWSSLELEEGSSPAGSTSSRPAPYPQRITETPAPPVIHMPSRGIARAGRRQGPLSHESRQNANDHKGWTCRDKPRFALPLEIGLGPDLVVPVREFLPVGDSNRPAYLPVDNGKQSTAVQISMYDLPVVISCDKEEEAANHIRHSLLKWFQQTIDCTHNSDWAWHWFKKGTDLFAGSVMKLICEYFQAAMPQHRLLKEALALSFFNYIFIYSFNVREEHVPTLQQRIEARIPDGAEYISPSIINLYIKMLMLPPLRDVVKRTLKGLELLLLEQQNARIWRRDLIFCISFIVLAYLGRTQVSIVQFANQPSCDATKVLTHQAATQQVLEMECEVADLIIKYHHQFLTPSPRRKASSVVATEAEQSCEEHAKRFNLMDKIRKLKVETAHTMPTSLDPQCERVGDFIANNTNRLCWKFVHNVVPEPGQRQDADTDMTL
ncbi:hypothetical protein LTR51_001943 [Lithohypha guttulata]|nr:hypothetical protein LTR51_001943 [Lithohypha guttulata]